MKTLIAYATKYGSVEKCAVMLKQKLQGEVHSVNLKEAKEIRLSEYDKVIIGGSIYAGTIQKEVTTFCTENLELLKKKKLGLFITCMNESAGDSQLEQVFPKELTDAALIKRPCGGEYHFSQMNFFEKMIIKMITKSQAKKNPSTSQINMKENISKLSEQNISKLANAMNQA